MSSNRDDHPAGQSPDQVPGGDRSEGQSQHALRQVTVTLVTGRKAVLLVPGDMTAEEAVGVMAGVAQVRAAIYEQEQATQLVVVKRPALVLPS